MATVYILFSENLNAFYTGSCLNMEQRFIDHLTHKFIDSFTSKASDWVIFLSIDNLEYQQARNIEKHIKSMKSKKYIISLKNYPDLVNKLTHRFL